jgi:hypothetical protein
MSEENKKEVKEFTSEEKEVAKKILAKKLELRPLLEAELMKRCPEISDNVKENIMRELIRIISVYYNHPKIHSEKFFFIPFILERVIKVTNIVLMQEYDGMRKISKMHTDRGEKISKEDRDRVEKYIGMIENMTKCCQMKAPLMTRENKTWNNIRWELIHEKLYGTIAFNMI